MDQTPADSTDGDGFVLSFLLLSETTVGRGPDEKIAVERGPCPIDSDRTVMILRLPAVAR